MPNPQRTIALNKIQWCDYYWINGKGDERRTKPAKPTVNGQEFSTSEWHGTDMKETMLGYATRRGLLDIWKPVCLIHVTANRTIIYTGAKATQFWRAWNKYIYEKK